MKKLKTIKKAIEAAGYLRECLAAVNFEEVTADKLGAVKLKFEMLERAKAVIDIRDRLFEIIGGK